MEKWKIAVIGALLIGLLGYGFYSNKETDIDNTKVTPAPGATPKPFKYQNQTIGSAQLPEWNISQWMNTKPVTLGSLKGSVAVVEIFRTECPHCQDAAPLMQQLYTRYSPRGLKMVAIQSPGDFKNTENPEIDWDKVQAWAKERGLKYPLGFDKDSKWFQGQLKGELYPTIMVFDRSGKVVMGYTGHDNQKFVNLVVMLEKLLAGNASLSQRAADTSKWITKIFATPETDPADINDPVQQKERAKDMEDLLSGKKASPDGPTPE